MSVEIWRMVPPLAMVGVLTGLLAKTSRRGPQAILRGCLLGAALCGLAAGAADLRNLPEDQFQALPRLAERIDPQAFDADLLGAAIFHATNRARFREHLRPLVPLRALDEAAGIEARLGNVIGPPLHENPFPNLATPADRFRYVGLRPKKLAENIALLTAYEVALTDSVGYRQVGSEREAINATTGQPVPTATYGGFAELIVQAWLRSPGHRRNLLDSDFKYLGCSASTSRSADGLAMIFGVQEFYLPQR